MNFGFFSFHRIGSRHDRNACRQAQQRRRQHQTFSHIHDGVAAWRHENRQSTWPFSLPNLKTARRRDFSGTSSGSSTTTSAKSGARQRRDHDVPLVGAIVAIGERFCRVQPPQTPKCAAKRHVFRAASRYSILPSPPWMGLSIVAQHLAIADCAATNSAMPCHGGDARAASSRTMPPLPDRPASDFELRLDQRHQPGAGSRQGQAPAAAPVSRLMKLRSAVIALTGSGRSAPEQVAGIDAVMHDHARICAKPCIHLAMTHIDGIDPHRAALPAGPG